jgi:threonine dehydratase
VTLDRCESIADGLLPVRPGDLTFAHVQAYVDEIRTVTDAEIAAAVLWLLRHAHLVVEPSGAAAVAAVRRELEADPAEPSHRRVAILSGGNVSLETLVSLSGTPARDMPLG